MPEKDSCRGLDFRKGHMWEVS